jgi:rhamnosyltransferase
VAKAAWQHVRFRAIPYAEDHQLALDMLFAGYAKVYMPSAAVLHSHDYDTVARLRRSFDEWRALREIYGYVEPVSLPALRAVAANTRADARLLRAEHGDVPGLARGVAGAAAYNLARYAGAVLGSRADRLPPLLRRTLSLERRATFVPAPHRETS